MNQIITLSLHQILCWYRQFYLIPTSTGRNKSREYMDWLLEYLRIYFIFRVLAPLFWFTSNHKNCFTQYNSWLQKKKFKTSIVSSRLILSNYANIVLKREASPYSSPCIFSWKPHTFLFRLVFQPIFLFQVNGFYFFSLP